MPFLCVVKNLESPLESISAGWLALAALPIKKVVARLLVCTCPCPQLLPRRYVDEKGRRVLRDGLGSKIVEPMKLLFSRFQNTIYVSTPFQSCFHPQIDGRGARNMLYFRTCTIVLHVRTEKSTTFEGTSRRYESTFER